MDFDTAFNRLLGFEGGYSNDAADPGGKTRFGVTEAEARRNGYEGDMQDLPQDLARKIYKANYWDACKCESLPETVRYDVFDAAVNSGTGQAAKWLQAAVGAKPDGVIGKDTIAAVAASEPAVVRARMNGARLGFMTSLPTWSAFGKGWARRIASILTG